MHCELLINKASSFIQNVSFHLQKSEKWVNIPFYFFALFGEFDLIFELIKMLTKILSFLYLF